MARHFALLVHESNPQHEEAKPKPGNVYSNFPYFELIFLPYAFIGGWFIPGIANSSTDTGAVLVWTAFIMSFFVIGLVNPSVCTTSKKIDENGREAIVRRPLFSLRKFEVPLDLEGIEQGRYDAVDPANNDPRLHDGYRYSPAWIRI